MPQIANAQPNTHAKSNSYRHRDAKTHGDSNCHAYRDFDTCAKSYSYTKGAPESAAPTVVVNDNGRA